MIVAFSTSSPISSVAIFDASGNLLAAAEQLAPMGASGACLQLLSKLLEETEKAIGEATLFLSDLGPGSFTGVRVGVALAKTLAYTQGAKAGGASSFDLISSHANVVVPNKTGEWFVRRPGMPALRESELPPEPYLGYGQGIDDPTYPSASRFGPVLDKIEIVEPERLVPSYLVEPAISKAKQPYSKK